MRRKKEIRREGKKQDKNRQEKIIGVGENVCEGRREREEEEEENWAG